MRDTFASYYSPTQSEFAVLWRKCQFAFDANVLLDFYRYTPDTQKNLFDILEKLKERIWLPHQAGLEFHQNRLQVIADMQRPYDDLKKLAGKNIAAILNELKSYISKHPFISQDSIKAIFEDARKRLEKLLQEASSKHPNLLKSPESDDTRNRLADLFAKKVGPPYDADKLREVHKQAEERFQESVPPGYADVKEKDVPRAYGDVVLWFQLIEQGETKKVPVIFVTSERKQDWWLQHSGRTIGPRPELRDEFFARTGQVFYMYETEQFMRYAEEFLSVKAQKKAIEEVRQVKEAPGRALSAELRELYAKLSEQQQAAAKALTNWDELRTNLAMSDALLQLQQTGPNLARVLRETWAQAGKAQASVEEKRASSPEPKEPEGSEDQ